MKILSDFSSRFNISVNSRSKAFKIVKSKTSTELLKLFYNNGYILGFMSYGDNQYLVYPNHIAISFHLKTFSKPSNKIVYNLKALKTFSNRGYRYIVRNSIGYFFSDTIIINRIGGQPVYRLYYFAL